MIENLRDVKNSGKGSKNLNKNVWKRLQLCSRIQMFKKMFRNKSKFKRELKNY